MSRGRLTSPTSCTASAEGRSRRARRLVVVEDVTGAWRTHEIGCAVISPIGSSQWRPLTGDSGPMTTWPTDRARSRFHETRPLKVRAQGPSAGRRPECDATLEVVYNRVVCPADDRLCDAVGK